LWKLLLKSGKIQAVLFLQNVILRLPFKTTKFLTTKIKQPPMFSKKNLLIALGLVLSQFASAQDVSYDDHTLSFQQKPAYPQYAGYTTFDMAAITTLDETAVNMNLPYQIKLGNLTQVPVSSDFHVVSVLRRFGGKFTSDVSLTANIHLTSYVYDRFGNKVSAIYVDKEDRIVNFDKALSKEERGNQNLVRQKVVEKVTESLLREFVDAFNGAKLQLPFELAGLSGVKKNPDLADFSKTVKEVKSATDVESLQQLLAPHVPYWEKMIAYTGDVDTIEIRRAAYQNLSIYNIITANTEKATEYIEKYKAIDKIHKMMMGLIRIKHSDNCEKMLAQMYPSAAAEVDETAPAMSLQELKDNFKYVTINGTVTVEAKKIGGTYQGQILISKLDNSGGGGILNLDAVSAVVIINTKDEKGEAKTIRTELSDITSVKDDKGVEYAIKKFGTAALGGAYYSLLKPSYSNPKITVYRTVIPADSYDYVIKKSGDDKGIKSSLLNSRKQLIEYLADCTSLTEKLKDGTISKKEKVEKIAEMYSACGTGAGTN
jgi:hypothetical protein